MEIQCAMPESCRIFLPHVCPAALIFRFSSEHLELLDGKVIIYFHMTQVLNIGTLFQMSLKSYT